MQCNFITWNEFQYIVKLNATYDTTKLKLSLNTKDLIKKLGSSSVVSFPAKTGRTFLERIYINGYDEKDSVNWSHTINYKDLN